MITRRELMERVVRAERDVRHFCADDVSREAAAVALAMYSPMVEWRRVDAAAADEVTDLVLSRFSPAEPLAVPGRDWLPSPAEVASYTAAVAESLAVPAPVKALPAKPRRWRDAEGQFWQERSDGLIALETERGLSGLFVCTDESQFADAYGPVFEVTP